MNQEKIVEYQLLEQQMQQLNVNLQNINQNIEELTSILKTLDEFKKLKKDDKILVPIANGIFAEATLKDANKLKVNVGSKIVVNKTPDSTKKMIESQIAEMNTYKEETVDMYEGLYLRMQALQTELIAEQQKEEKK
ncbi:MAG: prefoldin subunit alpha [archaeon]